MVEKKGPVPALTVEYLGPTRARMEPAPDTPAGEKGDLARLLRHHRVESGLSQSHLARLMTSRGHPWHQTTVVKTERAEREPRYTELLALAQILRIDRQALLQPLSPGDEASPELEGLLQQERLLVLRAELQERDLARLQEERKHTRARLGEVRRAITAARRPKPNS